MLVDFDVSDVIVHEATWADEVEAQRLVQFLLFRRLRVFFIYLAFNVLMWLLRLMEIVFWLRSQQKSAA